MFSGVTLQHGVELWCRDSGKLWPLLEHVRPKLKSMGFDGIHGAFWIGNSTGIDSPLGGGRCRRPILLIFEVG